MHNLKNFYNYSKAIIQYTDPCRRGTTERKKKDHSGLNPKDEKTHAVWKA